MNCRPVLGFEGLYEVSECGRVFSVDRTIKGKDGTIYSFPAKEKSRYPHVHLDYFTTNLYKNNKRHTKYVHRLVAEAWVPNPHNKKEVNHKDGNRQNNHVSNLEWVTGQENKQHAVCTGLRTYTNRLTRDEFIECLQAVIEGESYQSVSNRVPYQVPYLSTKLRRLAKEEGIEHLLDESLALQKQRRARINGSKNSR